MVLWGVVAVANLIGPRNTSMVIVHTRCCLYGSYGIVKEILLPRKQCCYVYVVTSTVIAILCTQYF